MATDADHDNRMILAAELALGLLDGADLDQALSLQRNDPGFAGEVERWNAHFEIMFEQWPEARPPAALTTRVRAAAGIGMANANDVRRWKWATALTGSIAAVFGMLLLTPDGQPPSPVSPPPQVQPATAMAVAFTFTDGNRTMPAMVDTATNQLRLPKGLDIPPGRIAQLWLIEGESSPQPIGLFEPSANGLTATIRLDRDIPAGSVLAISIEPPGGSPTGLPTGPVVATGELTPV